MRKSVAVFPRTERCGIVATGSPCLGMADAEGDRVLYVKEEILLSNN